MFKIRLKLFLTLTRIQTYIKASDTNKQCQIHIGPDSECKIKYYDDSNNNYLFVRENGKHTDLAMNKIYQNATLFVNTNKLIFTIQPKVTTYPECKSISNANNQYRRSFIFDPGTRFHHNKKLCSKPVSGRLGQQYFRKKSV